MADSAPPTPGRISKIAPDESKGSDGRSKD